MKRYFGFLGLALLFVFGVNSSVSAWLLNPYEEEISPYGELLVKVPKPASAKTEVVKWEQIRKGGSDKEFYDYYELTRDLSGSERVICVIGIGTHTDRKSVWLYGIYNRQGKDGAWSYSNESIVVENGRINNREQKIEVPVPDNAYYLNGLYSPFLTYCYQEAKAGLPKEVSELIPPPTHASTFIPTH